jgi:hypothetical protein
VRAPHPDEAPHDQRTAHLGNYPLGRGRGFGRPPRCASFQFDGFWKTSLGIATFVLMLGLSMLLEEQVLSSAGVS